MKMDTAGGAFAAMVIGFLTGMIALLTQDGVESIADIGSIPWIVLLAGSVISFAKDYQALTVRQYLSRTTTGKVNAPPLVVVLAGFLALAMLAGCSGTRAAYKAADGLEETAKVVSEHYFALVREANDLADQNVLTGMALTNAQNVVRSTRPVVIELSNAANAYAFVRSAKNAADLERAITNAALAVSRLIDVIKGRGSSAIQDLERDLESIIKRRPVYLAAA